MRDHFEEAFPPQLALVCSTLQGVRKGVRGWIACCPSHTDRHPSLSIGLGKDGRVLVHCFAGCSSEAIVSAMGLQMADLFPEQPTAFLHHPRASHQHVTVLQLAQDKKLPWQFLCNLGLTDISRGVRIPYYCLDGTVAPRHRIRTALVAKDGSWWNKELGEIVPYGLERLEEARKAGFLVLVEGESDCWTLWLHRFPALGLPGAEMTQTLKESYLQGIERLYVVQEPDAAGTKFVENVSRLLTAWNWQGTALRVSLSDAKDPNALHQRDHKAFQTTFQQALDHACQFSPETEPVNEISISHEEAGENFEAPFTLQRLLDVPFSLPQWVIPHLLPEGLLLLVGKPKQGKSWLALQMALAIASGTLLFDSYAARQAGVLYLALEDTPQRLQARTKQLLSTMTGKPTALEFAVQWPRLDEGGLAQLETYLQSHTQIRLVIIDTWTKLAPQTGPRARTQYEGDYAALAPLKHVADTQHISILVIHHLRKASGQDVLDEITGSTGLTGAVDGMLVLKRTREQEEGTLFVTGRDIAEQSLSLLFDPITARWIPAPVTLAPEKGRTS